MEKKLMGNLKLWISGRHRWLLGALLVIFLIALFLRLAVVWSLGASPERDALQYHQIALNQLAGYGHSLEPGKPTTMRPPLYPLFLAGIYALTGSDYRHALYAQATLNASLVFLLFWLGLRLSGQCMVGILTAILFALHTSFEIVSRLCSENLTIFLVISFFLCSYRVFLRQSGKLPTVGSGLLAGLLGLVHPTMALFAPVLFAIGLSWAPSRKNWRRLLIISIISMAIVTSWQIRNHLVCDTGQRDLYNGTLLGSYYPAFKGTWWWPVSDMEELEREREMAKSFMPEHLDRAALRDRLFKLIVAHPLGFLRLAASRVLILWASPPVGSTVLRNMGAWLRWVALVLQYVFVLTSVIMLVWSFRQRPELLPFLALAIYMTAVFGLIHSIRRYGYPLVPQLCLFAGWAGWRLWLTRRVIFWRWSERTYMGQNSGQE